MDGSVVLVLSPIALNKQGVAETSKFIVSAAIKYGAEAALAYIISQWPVDTAQSIAGFRLVRDGDSWNIENKIDYTAYVHDGLFSRIAPRALSIADKAFDVKFRDLSTRTSRRSSAPAYGDPPRPPSPTAKPRTAPPDPAALMRAAVKATIARRKVNAAATTLYNAGRITSRVLNLIGMNQVKQALSILRAERKYEEVKIINSALKA
jgi:hypothetical protein